jgi:hypothetical protein
MKKIIVRGAGVAAAGVAGVASATPVDLSSLTSAIDFSSATTAVLAVAVLLCGVHVAISGAKIVIRMVKSA